MTLDALCIGEMLIDLVPTVTGHGLAEATAFTKAPGGAPANVAVGLARLGCRSGFLGMVGDDAFGRVCITTLEREGVESGGVRVTSKARTPVAFVALQPDGEREFVIYHPGADLLLSADDIDVDRLAGVRVVHFGSIGLIAEPSRSATLFAVNRAKEAGAVVSYDPNLRLALWPDAASAAAGLRLGLGHASVVKASDEEMRFLTGLDDPERAGRALWHDGLDLLVVTCGRAGCLALTADMAVRVPGIAVEALDTTGAGDAFMAGLLAEMLRDPAALRDPEAVRAACRVACAAGALTVTGYGAIPALPTRAAVDALLARGVG